MQWIKASAHVPIASAGEGTGSSQVSQNVRIMSVDFIGADPNQRPILLVQVTIHPILLPTQGGFGSDESVLVDTTVMSAKCSVYVNRPQFDILV
jgi:hypothetical protein